MKGIKQANPPPPPHLLISISAAPEGGDGRAAQSQKVGGGGGRGLGPAEVDFRLVRVERCERLEAGWPV